MVDGVGAGTGEATDSVEAGLDGTGAGVSGGGVLVSDVGNDGAGELVSLAIDANSFFVETGTGFASVTTGEAG